MIKIAKDIFSDGDFDKKSGKVNLMSENNSEDDFLLKGMVEEEKTSKSPKKKKKEEINIKTKKDKIENKRRIRGIFSLRNFFILFLAIFTFLSLLNLLGNFTPELERSASSIKFDIKEDNYNVFFDSIRISNQTNSKNAFFGSIISYVFVKKPIITINPEESNSGEILGDLFNKIVIVTLPLTYLCLLIIYLIAFYLFKLVLYWIFYFYIWIFSKKKVENKKKLEQSVRLSITSSIPFLFVLVFLPYGIFNYLMFLLISIIISVVLVERQIIK